MTDVGLLARYTVGVTSERRRAELGAALERHGATIMYGPAIHIVALADDTELRRATERCVSARLDFVIGTTGVGFGGWLEAAGTWGMGPALLESVAAAQILARGPKVRGAVRAAGLREAWSPASESTAEVLEHIVAHDVRGARIAVQLHGEPLTEIIDVLRSAGAEVIEVPVYRWQPPADGQPLRRLIEATATAAVDCVTFTSAPAALSFLRTADEAGIGAELRAALKGAVLCVAVGPVTAEPLLRADVPVVSPERHRLGALVRTVVEQLPSRVPVSARI